MTPGAEQIMMAIGGWLTAIGSSRGGPRLPLVVAIDGHGASGKTTIAGEVACALGALTIHTDDHLRHDRAGGGAKAPAAGGAEAPAAGGAEAPGAGGTEAPAAMAQYYDWRALRSQALEPALRSGRELILVEGVSSSCPALADLVCRAVLVVTPVALRLERLHARISDEEWDEDWLAAERRYFATRPPHGFELVVAGFGEAPSGPTITAR